MGQPMITWSIAAARASRVFDRIVVSTDDPEIAKVAATAGAEVPFIRAAGLADDQTGVTEVLRDAIGHLSDAGESPSLVCLIYATAPLIQPDELALGLETLRRHQANFVISVTEFVAPVQRALVFDGEQIQMREPDNLLVRSQDLAPAYHDAGQFCWGTTEAWMGEARVFVAPTLAVKIPNYRVQDIDTPEDWARAEVIARSLGLEPA